MKYYAYLNLDEFEVIQQKTLEFIQPIDKINYGFSLLDKNKFLSVCPELQQSFDKFNLRVDGVALYVTYIDGPIHIDYKTNKLNECRINIPILNCAGSRTQFFSGGEFDATVQKNGLTYYKLKETDTSIVKEDEVEIIKPVVMRIQEPHRVVNNPDGEVPRICMTVFTDKDPVFLLNT